VGLVAAANTPMIPCVWVNRYGDLTARWPDLGAADLAQSGVCMIYDEQSGKTAAFAMRKA